MAQGSNVLVRHMWEAAVVGGMVALWFHRNKVHFEDESNNFTFCTKYVKQQVNCVIHTSKGTAHDHFVRLAWGVELKLRKAPQIKECKWLLPEIDQVKVNVDGSSMGNPRPTRWGATYRDHNGEFLLVSCKGLGVKTNYAAKCYAILENEEVAIEKGWLNLWLESDSAAAIEAFSTGKIPWPLSKTWGWCKSKLQRCMLSHTWREANFAADIAAKRGSSLDKDEVSVYVGILPWLYKWENPNELYFRFVT
ncbi:hypothetical protein IFM89_017128 [Coptis chinensis]|uniref:RNase H type-1 domain-containing protein n=1 Tax=Coptis chinensis TaxID=261450 RepID=A0A835LN64_9MAGN|nr:hypothetical protein IFM89_017128 [Coptis chinensis]